MTCSFLGHLLCRDSTAILGRYSSSPMECFTWRGTEGLLPATSTTLLDMWVKHLESIFSSPSKAFRWLQPCRHLFLKLINLFIYFWLCWVFVSVRGLSLVAASGGHSSSRCAGLSLSQPLLLQSTGSRRAGSVVVAHGPSCSAACGIFPDQGSNPCPLRWQAGSQPLRHQGSPMQTSWLQLHERL